MPHYPQCCAVSRPCKEYITLTLSLIILLRGGTIVNSLRPSTTRYPQQCSFHLAPSNSGTSCVRQSSGPIEHSRESSSTDIDPDTAIWCKNICLLYYWRKKISNVAFTCPSCSVSRPPMVERDSPSSVRWAAMSRGWDAVAVGSMLV